VVPRHPNGQSPPDLLTPLVSGARSADVWHLLVQPSATNDDVALVGGDLPSLFAEGVREIGVGFTSGRGIGRLDHGPQND